MLTSKDRAKLRSLANSLQPIFQIGKGGVTDNLIADVSTGLDEHELIKLNVLRASDKKAKEIIEGLTSALGAEAVAAIGNKIVIYRRSDKEGVKHIEF